MSVQIPLTRLLLIVALYMLAVAAVLGLLILTWEAPPSRPRRTRPPEAGTPYTLAAVCSQAPIGGEDSPYAPRARE